MINKEMYETGEGGSILVRNNDIKIDRGLFTDIYLALFASISPFWGNEIFDIDINSQTEKALTLNSLDAKGKENIKRAIIYDLKRIKYGTFEVELIELNDYLKINITINNNGVLQIIWNFTSSDINEIIILTNNLPPIVVSGILTKDGGAILTKDGQVILAK